MATVSTNIKIDENLKKEAQILFEDLGMSLSTAVNIFLKQAVREQSIPFRIGNNIPNIETLEAIEEVKKMKKNLLYGKSYKNVDEMMEELLK